MPLEEQFIHMIRKHEGILFKTSTVYTRTREDQQDLYQEIVVQLWRAFPRFRQESSISTWIYRIALNTAITYLRRVKRREKEIPIDQLILQYTDNQDPVFEDRVKMLYRYIEQLSDLDKGIMLLFLEDKSYEEIAEIIGISVSNVGTRLSHKKKKMKTQMTYE
ncbi:MAG: sigma-70 family RNA polymerase sigma factor [Saprospiraceae bacterium]|nr:sigma-70 family RNA polymerase sigma factor [Saprospiraceae bacterium]